MTTISDELRMPEVLRSALAETAPLISPSAEFIGTLAATDQRTFIPNAPVPAACGIVLRIERGGNTFFEAGIAVGKVQSSSNEASVLGLAIILYLAPTKS